MKFYCNLDAQKKGAVRFKSLYPYDEIGLMAGDTKIADRFPIKIDEGKKFYDILRFQDVYNFSVSDRIHSALLAAGITGWRSYPLDIEGQTAKYWGLQIIGRAGAHAYPVETGFIKGLEFDQSTWDGSDFFLMEGTYFTMVSERLHDLLLKLKATNLKLTESSLIEWYNSRQV